MPLGMDFGAILAPKWEQKWAKLAPKSEKWGFQDDVKRWLQKELISEAILKALGGSWDAFGDAKWKKVGGL
jgi:hypothetical protein